MRRFSITRRCFRLILLTLALFALLFLPSMPVFSGDENHDHRDTPTEAKEQQGQPSNHEHHHGHDKNHEHLRPALPQNNPSPEALAQRAKRRQEALETAEKIYRSMKVDPALASRGLGFDHNGQPYDMGMTLEQALIKVLADGNRCRVTPPSDSKNQCQLDIITKDKRLMSLFMKPSGDRLLIQSMTLKKLDGDGGIQQSGAKAAFYLMTFMHSR